MKPKVSVVSSNITEASLNQTVTVSWDAVNNPAGTTLSLAVTAANGTQLQLFGNLPLQGSQSYQITQHGVHHFTVHVSYTFGIETRTGTMSFDVHVV